MDGRSIDSLRQRGDGDSLMTFTQTTPDMHQDGLALTVGCAFELESTFSVAAVIQVAPCPDPRVQMHSERWDIGSEHHSYVDLYGNRCERLNIPAGRCTVAYEAQLTVSSPADVLEPDARETPVELLPDETISFVMPSRFCLPDELGHDAWQRFGSLQPGWERVQAIVDYVHGHLEWVSGASNPWTTAVDAYRAGQGVCRDFAHLAITLCRCMNIPARYCTGYLGDIGVPAEPEPMDFSGWFEVYLSGQWYTFDARHNAPRIGRILMGTGRDAADVALTTSFGRMTLAKFVVVTDEVVMA
jgi:transglutaminase-like putative cysteine protease